MVVALKGPQGFYAARAKARWVVDGCVATLGLTALHHVFISANPDNSFAPSFILAAIPLWALAILVLDETEWVINGVRAAVLVFAGYAALDFVLTGARAHAPLPDPNNFVTLLTLVWIPWALKRFNDADTAHLQFALTFFITLVVCMALLAAESRFALIVIATVVGYGWLSRVQGKVPTRSVLVTSLAVASAYLINMGLADTTATDQVVKELSRDQPAVRGLLNEATLNAISQVGGWLGIGLGGFALVYPQFRLADEQLTAGFFTHNDFLQLLLEGGVVLTLPLLVLCGYVGWRLLRDTVNRTAYGEHVGWLLALAVALAHAAINFVVVVLPLAIAMGVALGMSVPLNKAESRAISTVHKSSWVMAVLFVGCAWLYLGLDTLTASVFGGQPLPGVSEVRQTPERMMTYARSAHRLNPRRAVPILAQARLSEGAESAQVVDELYQRAIVADPQNPHAFIGYHLFLLNHSSALERHVAHETLLDHATALNPTDMNVVGVALDYYIAQRNRAAVETTASATLAWCELLTRRYAQGLDRFTEKLSDLAQQMDSQALRDALGRCAEARRSVNYRPRETPWLMRVLGSG